MNYQEENFKKKFHSTPKIVSIIPARLGSKGLKEKNICDLNGLPMLFYSLTASLLSKVNETWVSSESDKVLKIAEHFGSRTIKRPEYLSYDTVSTEEVVKHFLSTVTCDIVVLIQATSPQLKSQDINKGIDIYLHEDYDTVFSVYKINDMLLWNEEKQSLNYDYKNRVRRQDRKNSNIYVENGAFWIFTKNGFLANNNRIFGKIGYCEMPFWRSFQVDTIDDFLNIKKLI